MYIKFTAHNSFECIQLINDKNMKYHHHFPSFWLWAEENSSHPNKRINYFSYHPNKEIEEILNVITKTLFGEEVKKPFEMHSTKDQMSNNWKKLLKSYYGSIEMELTKKLLHKYLCCCASLFFFRDDISLIIDRQHNDRNR